MPEFAGGTSDHSDTGPPRVLLYEAIGSALGDRGLVFLDAIAPIVERESLNDEIVFEAGRFDEDADYMNCLMTQRGVLMRSLPLKRRGEAHEGHDWDNVLYFEGCLPVEVMAARGKETLRFGPMKP